MAGQAFVDDQKVGVKEVGDGEVFGEDFLKEGEGFLLGGFFEGFIVFLVTLRRHYASKLPGRKPLSREVLNKLPRFRGGQHALDFGLEHSGLMKLSFLCQSKQLLIRHCAPQEVAQSTG